MDSTTTPTTPPSDEDYALLVAWRGGHQAAGRRLHQRHHPKLYKFVIAKLYSPAECDEVIQDVFMAALESADRFRGDSSFKTYLFGIAFNMVLERNRKCKRARERYDDHELASLSDDSTSVSQILAHRDEDRLLLRALRTLPRQTQIVFELFHWERMKCREIAVVLNCSTQTITSTLSRGRDQLRAKMAKLADSPEELEMSIGRLSDWAERIKRELDDEHEHAD